MLLCSSVGACGSAPLNSSTYDCSSGREARIILTIALGLRVLIVLVLLYVDGLAPLAGCRHGHRRTRPRLLEKGVTGRNIAAVVAAATSSNSSTSSSSSRWGVECSSIIAPTATAITSIMVIITTATTTRRVRVLSLVLLQHRSHIPRHWWLLHKGISGLAGHCSGLRKRLCHRFCPATCHRCCRREATVRERVDIYVVATLC